MWEAFKQGYREAGGTGVGPLVSSAIAKTLTGFCWGIGIYLAFRLVGLV